MSTIQYEPIKDILFKFLDETFETVQGIYLDENTSLFETLASINAKQASIPVGNHCASIATQTKHIAFYLHVIEESLVNHEPQHHDWSEVWETTTVVSENEWKSIQIELQENYQRIREILNSYSEYPGNNELRRIMAVFVHTAYHLGEIRQALCTIK